MSLKEALKRKYPENSDANIQQIIDDMVAEVEIGNDPEEVLLNEGLEADYVLDLLDEL